MTGVKLRSGNTRVGRSGFYGVTKIGRDRWTAAIRLGKRRIYIGLYRDILEAARAYDVEAKKHGKKLVNNV